MLKSMMSCQFVVIAVVTLSLSVGCSKPAAQKQNKEEVIKEGREAIKRIKNNRSLTPQQRKDMIDRIRTDVEVETGEKLDAEKTP